MLHPIHAHSLLGWEDWGGDRQEPENWEIYTCWCRIILIIFPTYLQPSITWGNWKCPDFLLPWSSSEGIKTCDSILPPMAYTEHLIQTISKYSLQYDTNSSKQHGIHWNCSPKNWVIIKAWNNLREGTLRSHLVQFLLKAGLTQSGWMRPHPSEA